MRIRIGIDARLIRAYGIGTYVRGLLHGLAFLGGDEQYVVFVHPESRALVPQTFEIIETKMPAYSIRELALFGRIVDRARVDLLHVPHFNIPWTRTPIVATLHDAIPFHFPLRNPIAFAYIALMLQTAARRAERVITVSHAAKRDLSEALDVETLTVIHNGVDDAFFADGPRATDLGRYFLFVGRTARHKNVGTLLRALEIVRRRDPSIRLVLAGGAHPSGDGVIIPGFVDDERLRALYRGAIALVMPSLMEGFGLPALEAMALGTPAITSHAAALVEVTGDAALHAASAEEFADAMLHLANDHRFRAGLAQRGRARAQHFTWRRCAEETRTVYRGIH